MGCLAEKQIRATYGAVGEIVGVPARSVGALLGPRCPRSSWVVRKGTGEPTGYGEDEKAANLHRTLQILTNGKGLRRLMEECTRRAMG